MKNCRRLAAFVALIFVSCPACDGETSPSPSSGIEGVVTVSPAHPGPTREGVSNSAPLANATFTVENEKGVVASFTTDDQGRFHVALGPGHYTVKVTDRKILRSGPFEADVAAGKMTTVEWRFDSGMR
jgi:hypothetical protein